MYIYIYICFDVCVQAMEHEDNFFEKARRVVLRAMGVGSNKRRSAASSSHGSLVPLSAEELEAKQKIKVYIYIYGIYKTRIDDSSFAHET